MANFLTDSVFKKYLYNFTKGIYNEKSQMLGNFVSPIVQTPTLAGNYQSYDTKDALTISDLTRQPGQAAFMVATQGTPVAFAMTPYALDWPIDNAILNMDDKETATIHYETIAKFIVSKAITNLEYQVWTSVAANVTATGGWGTGWAASVTQSNVIVNPLEQISEAAMQIAASSSIMPNRIVAGSLANSWLVHSIASRGFFPAYMGATQGALKQYFTEIGMEYRVQPFGYTNNKGQAARTVTPFVGATDVYIFYAEDNPSLLDRSAFKTLQYGAGIDNLRSYQTADQRTTVMALDWYVQPGVLTNSTAIKRITAS
jgi:hypothetical protein